MTESRPPGGVADNSPERAAPAPRSPKRRAKRGRAAELRREIVAAQGEHVEARRCGHRELADRIEERLAALDIDLRSVLLAKEHATFQRLAAELGISVDALARIAERRDRAHGAAPDENPTVTGSPYRGDRWRPQLGRGRKGATAR